jgi:hypothetical protein
LFFVKKIYDLLEILEKKSEEIRENPGKSGKIQENPGLKIEMLQAITTMMINLMMKLNMRMMMPSSLDPTTTLVLVLR